MNKVALSEIAKYSSDRVSCSELTVENYVSTDNIRQNRAGKNRSQYVPTSGHTTAYKKGDILVANIRPYLKKIWLATNDGGSSADVSTLRISSDQFLPEFVYYNLFQDSFFDYAMQGAKGSKMPRIDKQHIMKFPIADFDINSQVGITQTLGFIDQKICINNKINAELEGMAKALYDYWFVQFDFQDENGKPYKTSGGKMVWSEELKREIPEDWEARSFESVLQKSKNGDWGTENYTNSDSQKIYCIRGADINALNGQNGVLSPPVRYIEKSHKDRILAPDDLIIEISGGSPTQSTGRIAHIGDGVTTRFDAPLVCSNFCKAITLHNKKLSYTVKHYWDRLYEAGIFFNFEGKTSGIKNLLFDQLTKDLFIPIPHEGTLVEEFHNVSSKFNDMAQNNLSENQKLTEFRDWLLPMLMNGQVRVGKRIIH